MQKGRSKQHTKAKGETGNHPFFFSCIVERVRDIVGQQLEVLETNMQKVIAKGLCLLDKSGETTKTGQQRVKQTGHLESSQHCTFSKRRPR